MSATAGMDIDGFCCSVCHRHRPLEQLLDLDCSCLVCSRCCEEHIVPEMVPVRLPKPTEPELASYTVGQLVRYRQRDGQLTLAKVVQIDRSIQPFGYGIQLSGAVDIRYTEHTRLLPRELQRQASTAWMQQGTPAIRCPHCSMALSRAQLSRICPKALQQLDEALNNAWLEAHETSTTRAAAASVHCLDAARNPCNKMPALQHGPQPCTALKNMP
eukprot:GHUV01020363.1.p1 GENE.GHUV01020363.1~~GHUV01020363.1.p1  ORF type:complete len:215 (+),score=39.10 GHUV01020363.1:618-1262(+)